MNKLAFSIVMACGLMFLHSPSAAAHGGKYKQHRAPHYEYHDTYRRHAYGRDRYRNHKYGVTHRRVRHMPRWLQRDRSFRRWYGNSRLRRDYRLSWHELFDIYRFDRRRDRHRYYYRHH